MGYYRAIHIGITDRNQAEDLTVAHPAGQEGSGQGGAPAQTHIFPRLGGDEKQVGGREVVDRGGGGGGALCVGSCCRECGVCPLSPYRSAHQSHTLYHAQPVLLVAQELFLGEDLAALQGPWVQIPDNMRKKQENKSSGLDLALESPVRPSGPGPSMRDRPTDRRKDGLWTESTSPYALKAKKVPQGS